MINDFNFKCRYVTDMQKTVFIILISALVSILSCKKKIEDSSTDTVLTGHWNLKTTCQSIIGGYVQMSYVYTDFDLTQSASVYSDSSCSVSLFDIQITAQYQLSNLVASDFFYDKWDLYSVLSSYSIEPKSSSQVTSYNTSNYCGFSNWSLNVAKNINGLNCGGAVIPSVGDVEYSFVVFVKMFIPGGPFSSRYPGDMYFGSGDSTHDGKSPEQRHNVHNLTYIFVK